jgi:flagellar biosynthesis GTPase FlhF
VASQYDTVSWAVFRPEADPSSSQSINSGPEPFKPTATETRAALKLLDRVSEQSNSVPPPQKSKTFVVQASRTPVNATPAGHTTARNPGTRPFTLIKDAQRNTITQLLGQVVTMNTYDSEKTILQITDYTNNPLLIDYKNNNDEGPEGDPYNHLSLNRNSWPGPWGQMVMQVTLWEPHAGYARENVKVGDIVLFTYVHVKMRRGSDILEAVVHGDMRYKEKIHVRLCQDGHDERTQELLRRRKDYWDVHGQPSKKPEKANKRKAKEEQKQQQQKKRKEKEAQVKEGQTVLQPRSRPTPNKHSESMP